MVDHSEEKGFLVEVPKMGTAIISSPSATPSYKNKDISGRWRKDGGPIGQAIRDGKIDLLMSAIDVVKKRRLLRLSD